MTRLSKTADQFAASAWYVSAGLRDVFRTAQFYSRDLANADHADEPAHRDPTFLSVVVARLARLADRLMTRASSTAVKYLLPGWRTLPSPFTPGMLDEVTTAIAKNSLVHNSLFNAYFFRAAIHMTQRYSFAPFLILEHRVDAARQTLADAPTPMFLAKTLIILVESVPVARIGKLKPGHNPFASHEPNLVVFAIACITLMFAREGKPLAIHDEDEFFAIVGALIQPKLPAIAALIASRDVAGLDKILAEIKAMY
jgi:hypothetical protein